MATETIDAYHRKCRDRISAVFLVGGSTRIPLVATLLHQESGIAPVAIEQPEFVVAEGGLHLPGTSNGSVESAAGRAPAPSASGYASAPPGAGRNSSSGIGGPVRRYRRPLLAVALAAVLVLVTIAGTIWWRSWRVADPAFAGDRDLREFASRFVDGAQECEAFANTELHLAETGLEMPDQHFRSVVRCQDGDWVAYFYNSGAVRGLPDGSPDDHRTQISDGVIKRSREVELYGRVSHVASSGPLQAYVEFDAADNRPGIYWEPSDRYTYRLGAVVLNRDPATSIEPLREIWEQHA